MCGIADRRSGIRDLLKGEIWDHELAMGSGSAVS